MSSSIARAYAGVVLAAPVSTGYQRESQHDAPWFFARALRELLNAARLTKDAIDGLAISSFSLTPDPPSALTLSLGLSLDWLESVPFGGASGIMTMRRAARAVQAGDATLVACIAADTHRRQGFRELLSGFSRASSDAVYPYGAGGPNLVFAMITQHYKQLTGAVDEDFGRLCVAQRENAAAVPHALLRKPLSLAEYLAARPIADPLRLFDCVMPCAGAEAFLVMQEEHALSLGLPCARILGAAERHNAYPDDVIPFRGGWAETRERLYAQAGVAPVDVDCLQTYDDYPVACFMQIEGMGLCAQGGAAEFVRSTPLTVDGGGLPHNTSGGQLSGGQAGAAGGFLGLVEALRQVTGQALGGQVPGAGIAAVTGYGMVAYDRCLASAAAIIQGRR